MATYALIHGAYDVGWYWHLVERELRERGHRTVAPDLPIEDDDMTLLGHAEAVIDAIEPIHGGGELIVVGQSWGGYIAPIVAELARADRLVLVAPMIPKPGETNDEMWEATGWTFPHREGRRLLPRRQPRTGRGGEVAGTRAVRGDEPRAMAARVLAGCAHPRHHRPRRSILRRRLAAPSRARATPH